MKIYKTTRMIEEIELDTNDFFKFLKERYSDIDDDIKKANSFGDLMKEWDLYDFEDELECYCDEQINKTSIDTEYTSIYLNYEDAYEDMEWGVH